MALVKVCPNKKCGKIHPANENFCNSDYCDMRDLTNVIPIPEEQARQIAEEADDNSHKPVEAAPAESQVNDSDKTMITPSLLKLLHRTSGQELKVRSGDILGRHNIGKEIFDSMPIVSRQHLQIYFQNGAWYVEDLGSVNGTTLNGSVLRKGQTYPIASRSVIKLANSCDLEVL